MSRAQRLAWFQLAVVTLSVVATGAAWPMLGRAATGMFGLLGLLGLSPWLFKGKDRVQWDERDAEIARRANFLGLGAFWLLFIVACVVLPIVYGWEGSVPVVLVQASVWVAWMLVIVVSSVATLVQYKGGAADAH
ncbi:MAG: hypothetical protein U0794_16010 [Isosphaeraceae bacterium]